MEERINKLENQLRAALEELESIKKELAEEKAKNAELTKENESLKDQIKEWQIKYEEEHRLVIKLTEENERLKAHIVELENQLKVEDEKPYDVADMLRLLASRLPPTYTGTWKAKSFFPQSYTGIPRRISIVLATLASLSAATIWILYSFS